MREGEDLKEKHEVVLPYHCSYPIMQEADFLPSLQPDPPLLLPQTHLLAVQPGKKTKA